jgi:hypothetical protein
MPRNWGTANSGWVEVDPRGNKKNRKAAREAAKEEAKWQEFTKEQYKEFLDNGGKSYGSEPTGDPNTFRIKIKR